MLQTTKVRSEFNREGAGAFDTLTPDDILRASLSFIRRQFSVIFFVTFLALTLGAVYVFTSRPTYTAQAQLLIDAHKVQIFQQQSILGDVPIDTAQVESQVEILKSENIASAVIKNLNLTEDPEFVGPQGGLVEAIYGAVYRALGSDGNHTVPSQFELLRRAIGAFESRLDVKRIGLTYVIQISFRSYNPERAAQIANAIADAYIVDQLESKYQATRRASGWLEKRIKELRDQVTIAERAVVDFKTKNNIVNTGGNDNRLMGEQQVAELTSQLVIARTNTAGAKARLDRINAVLRRDAPGDSFDATVADTLKSEIVSKLRSKYLELAAREADWSAKYGANHLAVVNLRTQMRELRNAIFEELKRLGETYKSDYDIAKKRETGLESDLRRAVVQSQATDAKSVTLRELESTAKTYKTIYVNFLQRYMEAVQQQSFPITEARVISAASRPLGKSGPKTMRDLMLALLGGAMLGFGVGFLRDLSDRVFRSGEQVESILQAECIALVPLVATGWTKKSIGAGAKSAGTKAKEPSVGNRGAADAIPSLSQSSNSTRSLPRAQSLHGTAKSAQDPFETVAASVKIAARSETNEPLNFRSSQTIKQGSGAAWETVNAPLSRYAEAMRSIKLAIDLNGAAKAKKIIGFTSSLPNEGKSTVAFSLAQLMCQTGARAIVVDCDIRNPSLSGQFAPRAKIGMLDVISGEASLEDAIWKDQSTGLSLLPAGKKFRFAHSSETLSSSQLKELFDQLRERYDYIVVDLPPLAPIVDVRAAARLIDSFVFVIEWGRTKIDVAEHALGHAQGVYANLLGVALNKVDMGVFGRYQAHREDFYYNKYYHRYGYTE